MSDTHNSSLETFHSICEYRQTVQWTEPNSFTIRIRWCSLRQSLLSYIIRSLPCSVVRCFVCITTAITIAIATEFSIAGWCVNIVTFASLCTVRLWLFVSFHAQYQFVETFSWFSYRYMVFTHKYTHDHILSLRELNSLFSVLFLSRSFFGFAHSYSFYS